MLCVVGAPDFIHSNLRISLACASSPSLQRSPKYNKNEKKEKKRKNEERRSQKKTRPERWVMRSGDSSMRQQVRARREFFMFFNFFREIGKDGYINMYWNSDER